MTKRLIAEKFLKENKFPAHVSMSAISKLLFKKYPSYFRDAEIARNTIRYVKGKFGKQNRDNIASDKLIEKDKRPFRYTLPEDATVDHKPVIIAGDNTTIILSDLHIPNHRQKPIEAALNFAVGKKINTVIINGDVLDNTPFRRKYNPVPITPEKVREWFDLAIQFFALLRKTFPKAKIYFLEGNHDRWYIDYLISHAVILFGDPYYHLEQRLRLKENNIIFIPENRYLKLNHLNIAHGHHLVKGIIAPVNAARGLFLRAKVSSMIGHVHVPSTHTEVDLNGKMITCWSTGCMCSLTPEYQPMGGKASHGFAYVESDSKYFHVQNFRIIEGKVFGV